MDMVGFELIQSEAADINVSELEILQPEDWVIYFYEDKISLGCWKYNRGTYFKTWKKKLNVD